LSKPVSVSQSIERMFTATHARRNHCYLPPPQSTTPHRANCVHSLACAAFIICRQKFL